MRSTRKAALLSAAVLGLLPLTGCGVMKGVGKVTVGAVKTTGKIVTWPVRAIQGKTGKNGAATAPVVGAGTPVEPGTVIVGARPVDGSTTGKTTAKSGGSTKKTSTTGYDGSEIYIDGVPIGSPSQVASGGSSSSRR